ncbi:unnamed protein product [Adineta ricciae]|uniref:ADP ribosyltransferase domain-containing protein n=1 Tax=Adineta ricciae TaxID=249248 RepID=A0A815HST0_ADIRI|nr:unnamed protein product [Adineta ricciae]
MCGLKTLICCGRKTDVSTISDNLPDEKQVLLVPIINPPLLVPDGITIVWLDANVNSDSTDIKSTRSMLYSIQSSVFFFDDVQNCYNALRTITNNKARIFLVVSGRLSAEILFYRSELHILDSVFIYCNKAERYIDFIQQYSPYVTGVYTSQKELQQCLKIELKHYYPGANTLNCFTQRQNAIRDLTYDAASFLWFQLLRSTLMNTQYDDDDMKQMLKYCRQYFAQDANKESIFKDIDEFERTYEPNQALLWYTRESFVYKIINSVLRMDNIDILNIFRCFISDLCRQLSVEWKKLRKKMIEEQQSPIMTVYRGCRLTDDEVEKLKHIIHGMASINGFVSTSRQRSVAEEFLRHSSGRRANVKLVLWIIKIDIRTNDITFADTTSICQNQEEEEILFNVGTAFRIDDVVLNKDTAFSDYKKLIEQELNETDEEVIFGTLLMDMGKHIIAQHYFDRLINRVHDSKKHNLAAYHYNLGLTHSYQKDTHLAERHFQQAFELQQNSHRNWRNMVRIMNGLGHVYQDSGQLDEAMSERSNLYLYGYVESIQSYENAMKILKNNLPNNHQRIGIVFNEMGNVYRREGKTDKALELYEKAELIFLNILPEDHPCIAYCWSSMGILFLQMNNPDKAHQYHQRALETYRRTLPADHNNIKISVKNSACNQYHELIDNYVQVCSQV